MLPSTRGWRLVFLRRRAAATAAGGANPFQPQPQLQPHAACFSHRFFSTPAARDRDSRYSHTTASYLVASCGLSPAGAAALASRGIRIVSTAKADAILALLRHHGFSDAHIALLIRKEPSLLLVNPEILRPKLEFFASLGFQARWLAKAHILEHSLNEYIIPRVEFLRGILGTDANIRLAASRYGYALKFDLEKSTRALQALRHHGLSRELISKLMLFKVGIFRMTPDRIVGILEDLEKLGLSASDSHIAYCFRVMAGLNKETWLRKVELYRSLGVSQVELLRAFKTQPSIMALSDENIKRKTRFFLDDLKLDLSYVLLRRPAVLGLSLEKCIIPRCAVLSVLMRKGKIKRDINLLEALHSTSKIFLKRYVLRYASDVPDVVGAYEGKIKFEGFKDRMV